MLKKIEYENILVELHRNPDLTYRLEITRPEQVYTIGAYGGLTFIEAYETFKTYKKAA